jgi:antitoxin component YwqK of YwqJK toxin-antitoxin module
MKVILHSNIYLIKTKILLNGKIIEHSSYHNSNGVIACEATFVNNIINGYRRFYHLNGKLKYEENFVNGELHGVCKAFDEYGILIKTSIYKNRKRVK